MTRVSLRGMRLGIPTLGGGADVSPASIFGSSLRFWLDASDTSTLFQSSDGTTPATANDNPVGYWGDKVGSNNATQSTTANKFTHKTNIQNGLSALYADGGDIMSIASITLSSFAIFLVFKATAGFMLYEQSINATANNGVYFGTSNNNTISIRRSGVNQSKAFSPNWGLGDTTRVAVVEFQGPLADTKLRVNGTNQTLTNITSNNLTASNATNTLYIGARSGVQVPLTGYFMEFFAVSPWPTLEAIAQAETYLMDKWAVS